MSDDDKLKAQRSPNSTLRAQITGVDDEPGQIVQTQVVRDAAGNRLPMLTRTNYGDWVCSCKSCLGGAISGRPSKRAP